MKKFRIYLLSFFGPSDARNSLSFEFGGRPTSHLVYFRKKKVGRRRNFCLNRSRSGVDRYRGGLIFAIQENLLMHIVYKVVVVIVNVNFDPPEKAKY